jgi:hypothetical protein
MLEKPTKKRGALDSPRKKGTAIVAWGIGSPSILGKKLKEGNLSFQGYTEHIAWSFANNGCATIEEIMSSLSIARA